MELLKLVIVDDEPILLEGLLKTYDWAGMKMIQSLSSYGRVDMGAVMAALILAVIPVVIFYLSCQKHIIKGVAAGAVKG